ncbi:hypothetical protein C7964_101560 [Loktanella sp. PT4BL]|nr:hypothetical protein C7964_101560 [Loktanella sp. PT4BL]
MTHDAAPDLIRGFSLKDSKKSRITSGIAVRTYG